MQYFKKFDFYGKTVSFFYGSSTLHRTIFGGLLSLFTFSLMMTITITYLYKFLYQKPVINSNVVFFINKKFAELEGMEIKGKIINEVSAENLDGNNTNIYDLDEFFKYYRIVLHEKYYEESETYHVAKITKLEDNNYQFNVEKYISDVFKEKEFSSLRIMSCNELLKNEQTIWPSEKKVEDSDEQNTIKINTNLNFDNSASMCLPEYDHYFTHLNQNRLKESSFSFSFDTPIYTVDRKGDLHKVPHLTQLNFKVRENYFSNYSMDIKYVVIEDDSNLYYTKKKYDAYFTMKRPILINEKNINDNNGFSMNINLENKNNEQIILITIYKYKLLEFLTKLGGLMKIVTIMKMTCVFWSNYFYEKTLYKLIVKRKNPYLEQKKLLLEMTLKNLSPKKILDKKFDPETSSVRSQASVNYNYTLTNYNSNIGPFNIPERNLKKNLSDEYCSYFAWVMNKFCKSIYNDKDARRKKFMITDTLGLNNYLLHLDYIDRQIILEQQTGEINEKINSIISRNNYYDESKDNVEMNLETDKPQKFTDSNTDTFNSKNQMKALVEEEE